MLLFRLSVCKDGLLLESGVPFTLPLYPGDCVIHELAVNKIVSISEIFNLTYMSVKIA